MRSFDGFDDYSTETRSGVRVVSRRLSRPLRHAHLDSNLITEFFFVFSRFEYALKRAGFVKPNRRSAEPDWDRFGHALEQEYNPDESSELARAVHYLLSSPPKRQIVQEDGSLGWESVTRGSESQIVWLLGVVRRIRNNLFHGGKYPYMPLPEPARDDRLLESSLILLDACLNWDEEVRDHFMSDLDG
jgi:hypothetical protein